VLCVSSWDVDITWPYHVTGSALSVVGPSLLLVRRSGTRYRTVSATRRSPATASDSRKRTYFVASTKHTQCCRNASWLCAILLTCRVGRYVLYDQARREPARAPGQTTFRAPPHPLSFPLPFLPLPFPPPPSSSPSPSSPFPFLPSPVSVLPHPLPLPFLFFLPSLRSRSLKSS